MTRRVRRRPVPRQLGRSFTIAERSGIDSLARLDARTARVSARLAERAAPPPALRAPREETEIGTGAESEPIAAPALPAPEMSAGRFETRGLGRVTVIMAGGTLLSRITGLLRLLFAAYALGINRLSDAFNLANNTPNIVHDLVLGGILAATFVPLFVDRLARRSEQEATESISAVLTLSVVVLGAATALFVVLAPVIIGLYSAGTGGAHIAQERAVATELLRIFALQLLGYGAISLMTAVLNTVRRFSLPAYVPILNNLIAIAVLIEFHILDRHPSVTGVQHSSGLVLLLGFGTTAGVLVQAAALVPATMRSGLRLRFRWKPRDDAVREIVSLSGWTFGFVLANQVALFVILALAVHVGPGSATAYTYAFTFFQLPFGMIAVSVMNTVTPELSARWSEGDRSGMAHQFGLGLRRMMAGIWPATAGYLVLAGPIMALLLRHGAAGTAGRTGTSGTSVTASLLALLAVGLPGYCIYLLAIRALQSMRDTRTAFFLYLFENGLNILLAFVLTATIGVRGLALSLSIAYSAAALVALGVLRGRMGGLGGAAVGRYLLRSFGLSLLVAAVVAVVASAVGSSHGVGLVVRVVAGVVAGMVVFGGGAWLAEIAHDWQTSRKRRQAAREGT